MKKLVSSLILSLVFVAAMAGNNKTTTLKGQVTDKTGEPIAGAKIYLENLKTTVYTDFEGSFSLPNVPRAENTIEISMVSYEEMKAHINLKEFNKEILSIQLQSK